MARHKHADLIHAWAEGAEIEVFELPECRWYSVVSPSWSERLEYRIKPKKKPDVVRFWKAKSTGVSECMNRESGCAEDNLKLTFSGETGKLIKAEVIND